MAISFPRSGMLVSSVLLTFPAVTVAQLSLTPAGVADGFALSTFVSGFPTSTTSANGCCGPFGSASTTTGNILVASYDDSKIYVFKDIDGQTLGSALSSSAYQAFAPALTNDAGTIYASGGIGAPIGFSGSGPVGGPNAYNLLQLTNSGGVGGTILTNAGAAGLATNPVNGHLIAEGAATFILGIPQAETLLDVNPLTKTSTTITSWASSAEGDGVVVSNDGKTAYVAFKSTNTITGFDIATGKQVFSLTLAGTPDGLGVIRSGSPFAGDLVSNNNDGTVDLIDVNKDTATVIASGGSRGDYTGQDLLNGTLFLTQTDSVLRLSCGSGCTFGDSVSPTEGGTTSVPEPATIGLLGLGLLGLQIARVRRRRS